MLISLCHFFDQLGKLRADLLYGILFYFLYWPPRQIFWLHTKFKSNEHILDLCLTIKLKQAVAMTLI